MAEEPVERCRAGVDNAGVCTIPTHLGWHNPREAKQCLDYDYDRCRREAGHEKHPSWPYAQYHLPDCGNAVAEVQDNIVFIETEQWLEIYDIVKSSGERLEW